MWSEKGEKGEDRIEEAGWLAEGVKESDARVLPFLREEFYVHLMGSAGDWVAQPELVIFPKSLTVLW